MRHKIVLSSLLFALFSAAPAALAQDECGPGPTVECDQASYANGITYNSGVDLSVTKTNSGFTTLDANGVTLTGTGSASVLWDSGIGRIVGGDMTNGPVLDVLTGSGDIDIRTLGVGGNEATVTHGIRARSTGGGNIFIDDRNDATSTTISATDAASGVAGIEAVSTGGDGDVEIFYGQDVEGTQYGILAEAAGSGDLTISGEVRISPFGGSRSVGMAATGGGGVAGIHATTGTGLLTVEAWIDGGSGAGAIIDAGGDVDFTGAVFDVGPGQYGVDLLNVAAGTTSTLNFTRSGSGNSARAQGDGTVVVNFRLPTRPPLGNSTLSNTFSGMNFDFTGMADTVQVNVMEGAIWFVETAATTVPDGNFDIYIRHDSLFSTGPDSVLTFEGNDRQLVNEGFVAVGPWRDTADSGPSDVRIEGLAEFRHSGRLLLGSARIGGARPLGEKPVSIGPVSNSISQTGTATINSTDARRDDVLSMPGAHWISDGGEVWMDIELGKSQGSCTDRDPGTGELAAADCLMLEGGSTEGVTYLTLFDRFPFNRGRLNQASRDGILLVDVSGGSSAQGDFVVGPDTHGYSPSFGGSWDRGLFQYVVAYDEDAQQHNLVGMLNGSAFQQAPLASTSHDLWRLSTGNWLGYQADRRETGGRDHGIWLQASRESADRDLVNTERTGAGSFDFDHSFERTSVAVTAGLDLLAGGSGDRRWSVGTMLGYVTTDMDYDASANNTRFNGWTLGAYAGFAAGSLWVDAAVNYNDSKMRQYIPGLQLTPPDTLVSNDLTSVGAQVDAGWRFPLTQAVFVEPLATLSYVRTDFDSLEIKPDDPTRAGLELQWNDPTSLRAGLGGRIGLNHDFGFMRGQLSLMARVLNESDGESTVTIRNNAFPDDPDIEVTDKFDDTFTEAALEASVHSPGEAVSGFLNLGSTTASDYDAFTAKLGVRVHW